MGVPDSLQGGLEWGQRMRLLRWTVSLCLCGAVPGQEAPVPESTLESTRDVVNRWVELRKTISRVRSDWTVEKEVLAETTESFQRELDSLLEQLDESGTEQSETEARLAEARAERERLRAANRDIEALVVRLEKRLRGLLPGLPPPLVEHIVPLTDRLPRDPDDTTMGLAPRLGLLVGLVGEINKFHNGITLSGELRRNEETGAEIQVRVLYLGISQAYYTDPAGSFCGTGLPAPGGWKWEKRPELAGPISRAIAIYEGDQLPDFVELPLRIQAR